jgi:hypothetical protein
VLFFHELVSKSLPERGNGGQIGGIRVYVLWSLRIRGKITESIKTPFLPHFHILQRYIHIMGDLPSKRFYEGLFLKRFSAVFWKNKDILGFFSKPCAGIHNFGQPGKTISPETANPGQFRAPFGTGYLMSGIVIIVSNITSYLK